MDANFLWVGVGWRELLWVYESWWELFMGGCDLSIGRCGLVWMSVNFLLVRVGWYERAWPF